MIRTFLLVFLLAGSACAGERFERVLSWGVAGTEEAVRAYAEIGVTDLKVRGDQAIAAARACGIRPYCPQAFLPCGKHLQVMPSAERERFDFLMGRDLQGLSKDERAKRLDARRSECRCRVGGEPEVPQDCCLADLKCFTSDEGLLLSKAQMDGILAANPEAEGIYFDGIGYANLHSCECEDCKSALATYLSRNALADAETNRNRYYLDALVTYVNAMVDYVRSRRAGIKVAIHLWPTFRPEPLYGRLIKADFVEETVAWYFPWEKAKISEYVRRVCGAKRPRGSQGVPFVGLNATPGRALAFKSPERLEDELRQILAAGGRSLSVCNGQDMLKPGYREVFRKFAPEGK